MYEMYTHALGFKKVIWRQGKFDGMTVISQVLGDWETRDKKLVSYREHIVNTMTYFD